MNIFQYVKKFSKSCKASLATKTSFMSVADVVTCKIILRCCRRAMATCCKKLFVSTCGQPRLKSFKTFLFHCLTLFYHRRKKVNRDTAVCACNDLSVGVWRQNMVRVVFKGRDLQTDRLECLPRIIGIPRIIGNFFTL